MKHWLRTLLFALAIASGSLCASQLKPDFERGWEAYTARNYGEAVAAWRKAANAGHARAQNGLGVLYRDGLGVPKDLKQAARWFQASANNGYAYGMYNLGLAYRDGAGIAGDDIEAYKWLLLSITVNFDEQAVLESNLLARRMSAAQIEEARARAQLWSNRFFFGDKVAGPRVRSIPATE
jgi:TPR repeat protein